MSKQKLTPWFNGYVRPARPGIYNASVSDDSDVWRHWNGAEWSYHWRTDDGRACAAMQNRMNPNVYMPWRGLAKEPK